MAGYIISLVVFLLVSMVMIIIGSLPIMMLYHNYLKKKHYK